ncbi:peptidase dimerization domain-containing protein [Bradyrhizobium betae]
MPRVPAPSTRSRARSWRCMRLPTPGGASPPMWAAWKGGIVPNMVAPHAQAELDVRFTADTDIDALVGQIRAIIEAESLPRTTGRITDMRRTPADDPDARGPAGAVPAARGSWASR